MRRATEHLAAKAAQNPMDGYRYTTHALALNWQPNASPLMMRDPALPWLARPGYTTLRNALSSRSI